MRRVPTLVVRSQAARERTVLLIGVDWVRGKDPPVSLASASIAAAVAERAPVRCLTLNINSDDDLHAQLRGAMATLPDDPPLIGLGAYIWADSQLNPLLRTINDARPDATVVLGGPQISYAPGGEFLTKQYPLASGFIRGYGEVPMSELAVGGAPPTGFHAAGAFDTGSQASSLVSNLPSPFLTGWTAPQRFLRWETQRGCPFTCPFCQHKAADGKRARLEAGRVLLECDWLCAQSRDGPLRDLAVVDPTFNQGPLHLPVLRRLAEGGLRGKVSLQCRLEMLTPEFLGAVNELRRTARVVLEFGVQTVHKSKQRHIERATNLRRVEYWLERLNAEGVPYELSFIYGLPAQTPTSFQATVQWASRQVNSHSSADARPLFFPLMLLRGTKLHEQRAELGLVASDELGVDISQRIGSGIPHVVASPTFTFPEWLQMHAVAEEMNTSHETRTLLAVEAPRALEHATRSRPVDSELRREVEAG